MAERLRRLAAVFLVVAAIATGIAPGVSAAPPDETCNPGQTFVAGGFDICSPPAVGAGLALVVAYFVLRRRAGGPLDPVDAGEWWTCANCGRQNVVGSPRCYSCGTWQGRARPDNPPPSRE